MFIWYIYTYYININLLCQVGQLYYHWLIDRRLIFERTHLLIDSLLYLPQYMQDKCHHATCDFYLCLSETKYQILTLKIIRFLFCSYNTSNI